MILILKGKISQINGLVFNLEFFLLAGISLALYIKHEVNER